MEEIESTYNVKLNCLENYEHIIIDIFKNDNLNYDLNDSNVLWIIGLYYQCKIKNYDEMKKYYLMAIELKNDKAMYSLGFYYQHIEHNYDEMKKYCLMAIELNNVVAMITLGYYSYYEKNYDEMKKCYLMAIEFNNSNAMNNFASYYYYIEENYDEMKKYFLMAIELKNNSAMYNLATYYLNIEKNYNEMKKYYLMAIELKNDKAMLDFGHYYYVEKNYDEMKKYYLMAIELNNNLAMDRLLSAFSPTVVVEEKKHNNQTAYSFRSVSFGFFPLVCINKEVVQHYLLRQINSKIAIEKVKELEEKNNFLGVKIFKELTEYCFNPQRLLKLCNIYKIEFDNYMDII